MAFTFRHFDLGGGHVTFFYFSFKIPSYDHDPIMNDVACFFNSLYNLYQWGFVLLNNAPKQDGVVMKIVSRIGRVRSTQFG